jgi:hypothetical protein
LNLGHKYCDVIGSFKGQIFQLSTSSLYFFFKCLHLLSQRHAKLVQDLFVDLVVLVVHFALDSSIADFQATEALEVFRSVESLATLPDLIQ